MASIVLATTTSTLQVRFEPMNSHGRSSNSFCCFISPRVVLRPSAGYAKQQRLPSDRRSSRTSPSSGAHARHRDDVAEYLPRLLPILQERDRKSTRLNSSHRTISYAVFCLKKKISRTKG